VIGTDCIGSCNFNYHMITMAPKRIAQTFLYFYAEQQHTYKKSGCLIYTFYYFYEQRLSCQYPVAVTPSHRRRIR
jgi:hypothetical protein